MDVDYVRVSRRGQNPALQRREPTVLGCERFLKRGSPDVAQFETASRLKGGRELSICEVREVIGVSKAANYRYSMLAGTRRHDGGHSVGAAGANTRAPRRES